MRAHPTLFIAVIAAGLSLAARAGVAADLPHIASMKDTFGPAGHTGAGPCYLRADTGYSWAGDGGMTWAGPVVTDAVTNVSIGDTWLIEGGVGCGSGSRGLRGELVLGYHGDRDVDGRPAAGAVTGLASSADSLALMVNGYYDLGNFRGFVPYLGAGLGIAWNSTDAVVTTPAGGRLAGESESSFAWAVMAGVGYQVSERAILDLGYRYIDLGDATSGTGGGVTAPVRIHDLAAHEIKLGLRYHFGGGHAPYPPQPLK
jgi:opacity protein-like surface antigen